MDGRGYFLPNNLDLPDAREGRYLTDRLADEAVQIIDDWQDRPFFMYFAFYTVHTPIQGKKELVDYYQEKLEPGMFHTNPTYAAMTHSLDEAVGNVLDKLDEAGIADNTAVFFSSDNGGLSHKRGAPTGITLNHPLRRGKGSAYEGGTRVPYIVRWPGVTAPGSVSDEPVASIDFYPTALEIADTRGDTRHNAGVDGRSIVPLLKDARSELDRDALYWHYPHYHAGGDSPYGAIRRGDWRLVEFYEDMRVELYNLADDRPELTEMLRKKLHGWRESVDARMPTPNPDFDPTKTK